MTGVRAIDEDIALRPATPEDTEFARAVHHAAIRDVVVRQFGSWNDLEQRAFFERDWGAGQYEIIEFRGTACGYLRVGTYATHVEVHEIDIEPRFQGNRIGTRLLQHELARATALGLPVELQVLHLNHAVGLYRRLGFAESAQTATHIKMRWLPN